MGAAAAGRLRVYPETFLRVYPETFFVGLPGHVGPRHARKERLRVDPQKHLRLDTIRLDDRSGHRFVWMVHISIVRAC